MKVIGDAAVAGGSYADVWKGEVRGEVVAIKLMRIFGSDVPKFLKVHESCSSFIQDVFTFRSGVLARSSLVGTVVPSQCTAFYGIYHWNEERSRVCLVSPWMAYGTVVEYLEKYPHADRTALECYPNLFPLFEVLITPSGIGRCLWALLSSFP